MRSTNLIPLLFCVVYGSGQNHLDVSEDSLRAAVKEAMMGSPIELYDRISFLKYKPMRNPTENDKYTTVLRGWFLDLLMEDGSFFESFLWFVTKSYQVGNIASISVKHGAIPEARFLSMSEASGRKEYEVSIPLCTSKEDLKAKLMQVFH
jgi:hypothetical protein